MSLNPWSTYHPAVAAAGARDDSERHLRKPEPRPRVGDAVWQASAISRPPPRTVPCIAAITGMGRASNLAKSERYSASLGGPLNSPMSAPEKNVKPSHLSTTALTPASWPVERVGQLLTYRCRDDIDGWVVHADDGDLTIRCQADDPKWGTWAKTRLSTTARGTAVPLTSRPCRSRWIRGLDFAETKRPWRRSCSDAPKLNFYPVRKAFASRPTPARISLSSSAA
jgi:hypothetical protein